MKSSCGQKLRPAWLINKIITLEGGLNVVIFSKKCNWKLYQVRQSPGNKISWIKNRKLSYSIRKTHER
jgi:hypothetical protein